VERLFPHPAQVADGVIVDRGDIDGGEIPRAHKSGQWHGVTTVGVAPVARLFRNPGGGDNPADSPVFVRSRSKLGASGTGVVDEDE